MAKAFAKMKVKNFLDPEKSVGVEALVDTGATMVVLPRDVVRKLELKKVREVKVKYADGRVETRPIYGVAEIEVMGRSANLDVLEGSQPLIGQVLLELLDLLVDPKSRKLVPNPESPEMPMMEVF